MIKCTFCGFENEDGQLCCDQCKTDLSALTPVIDEPGKVFAALQGGDQVTSRIDGEAGPTIHIDKLSLVKPLDPEGDGPLLAPHTMPKETATAPEVTLGSSAAIPAIPAVSAVSAAPVPIDSKPRLIVIRGEKINEQYPLSQGKNYLGRTDEKPVDIDLENQEAPDRIWTSRQHAVITFENGLLTIEDLNSLNGTFVNRSRVHPGQVRTLQVNDVVQVGTVHLRVVLA